MAFRSGGVFFRVLANKWRLISRQIYFIESTAALNSLNTLFKITIKRGSVDKCRMPPGVCIHLSKKPLLLIHHLLGLQRTNSLKNKLLVPFLLHAIQISALGIRRPPFCHVTGQHSSSGRSSAQNRLSKFSSVQLTGC